VVVDEFTGGVCVEYVRDAGGREGEGLCLVVDGDVGRCEKLRGSAWAWGVFGRWDLLWVDMIVEAF
jgi:hypothetical protein